MIDHLHEALTSSRFIPHGHCYLWIPSLLWLHVGSDMLIGSAYVGISVLLYILVRTIQLPFSPVFIAFGLFIGLCGLTHFMEVWTVWNPHYWVSGYIKAGTAAASVATAVGLVYVKPQVAELVYAARLSEERRNRLETANAELATLYEKVKELDQLRRQFFANVSHELRTPLALILGPVEQLLQDEHITPPQRQQLSSIQQNAKALVKQVNDLLDASRLEAGKMPVRYMQVDIASWFRRIASQFELTADQRRIGYRVAAPERLIAQVDPDMIERVLINLLSNAFKFTPHDGTIEATLSSGDDTLYISVSDSGPGVHPEQHAMIFERFRQAEGGATRTHGGTGLGLAIVKDFVDLHRGHVDVRDTPGGGATFDICLPAFAPEGAIVEEAPHSLAATTQAALDGALHELDVEAPASDEASAPVMPGRPHVLVVEDNRDMREFIAQVLASDYNVVTAADGQAGLDQAEALQPDIVVTDIMMPRMSGEQLVQALRARPTFASMPILLLSAKADESLRVQLLRDGAQDYIHKPFSPSELVARVTNLVMVKRAADTLRQELSTLSTDLEVLAKEVTVKNRHLQTALDAAEVAREQAERASEAKSYFLGMISHELRTPLTTLQMNFQLLLKDRRDGLPTDLRPKFERLANASRQMNGLIDALLEYTRLESGRIRADIQSVDLAALAEEVVEEHRLGLAASRVSLTLEAPHKPLSPLATDPRLIKVIISNLVANAIKFTQDGTIVVRLDRSHESARIVVADTGLGIPEDALERIFVPFEQLEPLKRKATPGIGLGLALVKEMAEQLGGSVVVSSEPGVGSTFTVTLPAQLRLNDASPPLEGSS